MSYADNIYFINRNKALKNLLFLFVFKIPFSVARFRISGVSRTGEDYPSQTKGLFLARYLTFNTETEKNNRTIKLNINPIGMSNGSVISSTSSTMENMNPPELKALGKYSSRTMLKQDKLSMIADKLDEFIEQTNKKLNEFSKRLDYLEACQSNESKEPKGKRKTDQKNEPGESYEPKIKKRGLNNHELDLCKESEGAEEVDYPLGLSQDGFIVDKDGFTVVYTDGACSNNGRRGSAAGVGVWFNHNNAFNLAAPVMGTATNNNAEIQAATRAIDQAILAGIRRLNIHTDSEFMINCMTNWIKKWKKNNWVTAAGGPVKNKEQLVMLDDAIRRMEAVKWTHVRGHQGIVGNECADALAIQGAKMYKAQS